MSNMMEFLNKDPYWDEFLALAHNGEVIETEEGFISTNVVGTKKEIKQNCLVRDALNLVNSPSLASSLLAEFCATTMGKPVGSGTVETKYHGYQYAITYRHGTEEEVALGEAALNVVRPDNDVYKIVIENRGGNYSPDYRETRTIEYSHIDGVANLSDVTVTRFQR